MTKKSFRLYFKSKTDDSDKFQIMDELAKYYRGRAKLVDVDKSMSVITVISIGYTKLYEILDAYFSYNPKTVEIFIEKTKIERFI